MRFFSIFFFILASINGFSQFAPQVGIAGSKAIHRDSLIISKWANGAEIEIGWQDISDTLLGKVSVGDSSSIIGIAGNGILSLGDGGIATLSFPNLISNGPGPDFVVFENGFKFGNDSVFLELAFVEVSSDGIHFVRFPATSLTDTLVQTGPFGHTQASKINNLAGKYIAPYGTPFDLEELKDSSDLDINSIQYVRIIDVIGSLNNDFSSLDFIGNKINDPWPTPFPSSGFDLDAVGLINYQIPSSLEALKLDIGLIYPNPIKVNSILNLGFEFSECNYSIINIFGELVQTGILYKDNLKINGPDKPGIYFLNILKGNANRMVKLIVEP
ncbi:MAG: T9SS type A sorting domain-containing protein [Bacteroidia bacterium]|nr:T9SS type A sorting domain-containing protein [Bacteroidia bacterium]MCF8425491.1 T9SS type A sorting domain-containing protein [Bacteroidia bacterium]MCF8447766.1 T9SS type A sorting domain-containing protein [Bacteroidia bacterium]